MRALVRLSIFTTLLGLLPTAAHADILIGTKREAVIAELGKPTSAARRGTHEILIYPKGVRIELEGNEVSDIKGYIPKDVDPATVRATQTPAPTPAPAPSTPAGEIASPKSLPAAPAAAHSKISHPERVRDEEPAEDSEPEPSLGFAIGVAAAMLVAQFVLTFAALKIAFHYHQMDALWSGILAITGIDVGLQTLFAIFLYFQTGEVRLGIAGTGLPGLAMIWTIRQFCLDQRWSRAVATASAVKTASILLNLALLAFSARFS